MVNTSKGTNTFPIHCSVIICDVFNTIYFHFICFHVECTSISMTYGHLNFEKTDDASCSVFLMLSVISH